MDCHAEDSLIIYMRPSPAHYFPFSDPPNFRRCFLSELQGGIVSEMFLWKHPKEAVLKNNNALRTQWEKFRRRERRYTWPSRPVLFDKLEELFIRDGFDSPIMYIDRSPGLIRVKNQSIKKHSKNHG